jgi:aspartyl-tRNA(Asn)/glutamyl-tRNA(Gln) amidotransferase subunit A
MARDMTTDAQIAFASISQIGKLYRQRKLSPVELTRFLLQRIKKVNPHLNALITVSEELALRQARRAESELGGSRSKKARRDRGPLHGIPISLKDNIQTAGVRTTAGSRILQDFVPLHDAPVVTALKKAGAVMLGKTNMHEFAYGATSNNPHYGAVKNPWDRSRISGGSSGGSAAALAAGLCYGSIGTDTGGSIRIPASLCGVVGLKPGLGRVGAERVVSLSPTLDFVGPLARSAEDAALLLDAIGKRGKGERSLRLDRSLSPHSRRPRLGIPKEFFMDVLSPEVERSFQAALNVLQKHGACLKEVSLPLVQESEFAGNQIAWAEATHYHQHSGWYPAHAAEYSEEVSSRLEMGTKVPAVVYMQALELRQQFIAAFHVTLEEEKLDALAVPTTPIAATLLGEESVNINGASHPTRALLLRLNRPANLAGVPAISVPCGLTENGLPVGLQLIGPVMDEVLLLELAHNFERINPIAAYPALDSLD